MSYQSRDHESVRRRKRGEAIRNAATGLQVELLEQRMLLSWGGVPPQAVNVPQSAVAITLDSQSHASGSASIARNEVDYYSFVAPRTGSYTIETQTPSSNLDTVLGVFNSAGRRIAYNDDVQLGVQTDSNLTVTLQAGSRYVFGITNYQGTGGGSYAWLVNGPANPVADDSFEENDSLAQASDLGTLASLRTISGLVMADSQDWFRFQMAGTGNSLNSVAIQFQHSLGDLDLRLYDSSGALLSTSEGTTDSERISLAGLSAGTYYVQAYGYRGVANPSYSLTIDPGSDSPAPVPSPSPSPTGGFHIALTFHGLTASQQSIFDQAAARWEQVITGDLPNAQYNGVAVDDVLIDASGAAIDGVNGVLGQAGPDRFRSGSSLPYHGTMEFDTADLANMEANGTLRDVISHEMGHVLGIGTIWTNLGLLSGAGGNNPCFTGAAAVAEYDAIFGRSASCVPVENSGGAGTRNSHWRESVFATELMTGYVSAPGTPNPLSRVTVASMQDLGYTVNLSAADPFVRPGSSASISTQSTQSSRTHARGSLKQTAGTTLISNPQSTIADEGITQRTSGGDSDVSPVHRVRHPDRAAAPSVPTTARNPSSTESERISLDAIDDLLERLDPNAPVLSDLAN